MRCVQCGSLKDKVLDSRSSKDGTTIRRRRECLKCTYRYTTYEQIERTELRVVKRDGAREALNREKLMSGLIKACEKRPVPMDRLDRAVEEILTDLHKDHLSEVPSAIIGGKVMDKLHQIDPVAYVRYVSVYRQFEDVNEFIAEIQSLSAARRAIRSSGAYSRTDGNPFHLPPPNLYPLTFPPRQRHPVISLIGNRPALQIGRYQVIDYDTAWLDNALKRAAQAAEHEDFPFIEDIRSGIVQYLETKCPLKLLHLEDLFDRMRKMLVKIGCERIAEKLEPLAPPVTVSLVRAAMEAGNGFELAFFETLRVELAELRSVGAEEIRFIGLRESSLILRGTAKWNKHCESLLSEIEAFLQAWSRDQPNDDRQVRLCVESES